MRVSAALGQPVGAADSVQRERLDPWVAAGLRGGSQSIHSHVTKIEVITQKILEMNSRGDRRINEGERGG